ncbi:hypothetical protein KVR01_009639 [Diaporthe batatas]|uniref:uncharacterized protein n=1 Tax=Diaporthe batatas TaxID=748121 RepID=UPI001D03EDD2|nr:uncharacterized protein KVR01_009639 [Diaporthe batatas]KAG8160103.1 hypothetical protein KVR01_009639 [Diaporthe batatas]
MASAQRDEPKMVDHTTGVKPEPPPEDEVPPLTHVIPTIFVPLTDDFLKPIEPAKDRVERMQRMKTSLDANEAKVRDNINWIYEREARRHVTEAQKAGTLSQPRDLAPFAWEEADRHLANIAAPANPGVSYHLPPEKIAEFQRYDQQNAGQLPPDGLSPHERLAREVLAIAQRGVRDMEEYSTCHIKSIRDQLDNSIEREKRAHA